MAGQCESRVNKTCGNCRWGVETSAPGDRPAERVRRHWVLELFCDDFEQNMRLYYWEAKTAWHARMVSCERYPKAVDREKSSVCGEHEVGVL
jgi:hypothetical protein